MKPLLLFFLMMLVVPVQGNDNLTTSTVVVSAMTLGGMALPEVTFNVEVSTTETVSIKTSVTGLARTVVTGEMDIENSRVTLEDDELQVAELTQSTRPKSNLTYYFFRLIDKNIDQLPYPEKLALLEFMPTLLGNRRENRIREGEPFEPQDIVYLSALLDLWKYTGEKKPPVYDEAKGNEEPEEESKLRLRLEIVSELGQRVSNRLVELYTLSPETQSVEFVDQVRANRRGIVFFEDLVEGQLYRAYVPGEGSNSTATSPPFVYRGNDTNIEPLILFPSDQTVTGIISYHEKPLKGIGVALKSQNRPTFITETNEMGYFQFKATSLDNSFLSIDTRNLGKSPLVEIPLDQRGELIIPIDIFVEEKK